jgi:hypothetical protein
MLLGEELEIRRRLAHIDWSEDCLARFRAELGPPDFVHAWRNHRTVRKSLYKYRDIGASVLDRVHADIKVMGGVRIVTERGPTSAIVGGGAGSGRPGEVDQKSLAEIALISEEGTTEFRREVFRTSSPLKSGGAGGGGVSESDMSLGTSSLAQSFRDEINGGDRGRPGQQAPNAYALAPTMATLGLPSANMRPAGGIGDNALLSTFEDNSIGSTHEEWLRVMRQNEGLPDPQPIAVDSVGDDGPPFAEAVDLAALGVGGSDGGSSSAQKGSSGFRAVDSFVEAQVGNTTANMSPSPVKTESPQGPPSPAFGQALPPPPMQSPEGGNDEEDEDGAPRDNMGPDNQVPAGPMGKYWRRHSLTRLKQQMRRNMAVPTLPDLDSEIVKSPNNRALVYASLPKPMSMELRRLELDPLCRTVEDLQNSLAEHIDGKEGMLLLCQSGDYKFGAYAERIFKIGQDEENEDYIVDSHYGTQNNYLFSITHDLKIPYHGRARVKKPQNLIEEHWMIHAEYEEQESHMREDNPYSKRGWESFYSEHGVFRFGETDFVINESFDHCSSCLESSFGCAFRKPVQPDGVLAGRKEFKVDKFEVFLVDDTSADGGSSGGGYYQRSPGPPGPPGSPQYGY